MNSIVLASKSPRRQELLSLITEDFDIIVSDEEENVRESLSPFDVPEHLAKIKAQSVAKKAADRTVIGADTVVILDNKVMGKPKNREDAVQMLSSLSGKRHTVVTGVCIISGENCLSFSAATEVEFYPLTDKEIADYVSTGEPLDKAGAYGIQGIGSLLVKEISGDYCNVVGLPVSRLNRELRKLGVL